MNQDNLTRLEEEVLELILEGDDPTLGTLREQLAVCRVQDREMTGVGFFTTLAIPASAPRLDNNVELVFGDVVAEIDGVKEPAGFLTFVEDGALKMLEGFTFGDRWPERVSTFQLSRKGESQADAEFEA